MDDKEIEEYVYGKQKSLDEICCSMPQIEGHMAGFLSNAKFPLKPQNKNMSKISEDHIDVFILDLNDQRLEVDFHAKDSYVSSSKIITCRKRIRDSPAILSGTVTLGLIRKSEKDYHEIGWDEMENRKNSPPEPIKDQWNNPAFYTKRKEWEWQIGKDSKKYEITSKGDLIILRNKVIKEFMKCYISKLKQY